MVLQKHRVVGKGSRPTTPSDLCELLRSANLNTLVLIGLGCSAFPCHQNLRASLAQIKKRNNIMQEDKDIRDIRAGLALREELVKDAETRTRGQHDYRFVLQYFSASRDLHRTLVANVNYLANEVEQLRANMDHTSESITIMEQQFVELEVGLMTRIFFYNPVPPLVMHASTCPDCFYIGCLTIRVHTATQPTIHRQHGRTARDERTFCLSPHPAHPARLPALG